jgi:hypothetical protein
MEDKTYTAGVIDGKKNIDVEGGMMIVDIVQFLMTLLRFLQLDWRMNLWLLLLVVLPACEIAIERINAILVDLCSCASVNCTSNGCETQLRPALCSRTLKQRMVCCGCAPDILHPSREQSMFLEVETTHGLLLLCTKPFHPSREQSMFLEVEEIHVLLLLCTRHFSPLPRTIDVS